ncbi:MAG: universal stress protein [Alphaproteobacteria bacterium]|nr:universal stress protein [Alphaproteobacteria bacterium]
MSPRNILVPVDGSENAVKAVEYADNLANDTGARLTLIHVMEDAGSYRLSDELRELAKIEHVNITERDVRQSRADRTLAEAAAKVVTCKGDRLQQHISEGNPTDEIVGYARENGIDLIVIASRGLSDFRGLLLGSVSHKVVQLAECPCLVVRQAAA